MSFLNLSGRIGTSAGNIPVLDANGKLDTSVLPNLGNSSSLNTGTSAGNIPVLDASGKLDTSVLPSLAITDVYVVVDATARNALTVQTGDVAVVTGESKTYIYDGMAWQEIKSPTGGVTSVNGQTGTVSLAMANLSNVAISGITTGQYLKWNGTVFVNTKITFAELISKPTTLAGYSISDAATSISPTLTGIPLAPTAPAGTSTAQIATTAFVANSFAPIDSPSFTGVPSAPTPVTGTATQQLATTAFVAFNFASLDSPMFSGTPTAPTPTIDDVSTQIATTEFVTLAISNSGGGSSNLPSQTGNTGKYLTTDGTTLSWGNVSYTTLTNKPTIPLKTSELTNDSGFITSASAPVTSIFGRTGVITANSGDYTVTQITGAAPLDNPTFTGTLTSNGLTNFVGAAKLNTLTVTDSGSTTINFNFASANNFEMQIIGSRTLGIPNGLTKGQSGSLNFIQDSVGARVLTFAWCYTFPSGKTPMLSTTALAWDKISYEVVRAQSSIVTISFTVPAVVTWANHGLLSGDFIQLTTTGALPTGLTANTTYWVGVVNSSSFKLATSKANAAAGTFITTSGTQSGSHTATAINIQLAGIVDFK